MITVSETAVGKIKDILRAEEKTTGYIRVGVKGGGCSGFTYILDIEEKQAESDQLFNFDGVKVLIDSKSIVYLAGTELDYTDGLNGSGFIFNNPNAQNKCGCGDSFAV